MNLKLLLDEAVNRGEKIKDEILAELFKSKTIQQIVSNKNFVTALSRVIETKNEVKKVINNQVKQIFSVMDVPSRDELMRVAGKLGSLEKIIEKVGRKSISVKVLKSSTPKRKKTSRKTSPIKNAAKKKTKRKK